MINQSHQKNVNQNSPILETNIPFANLSATIQPIEISHSSMTNSTNTCHSESSSSSYQRGSSGLLRTDKNFEQQQLYSLSSSQSDRLAEDRDYKAKCRSIQAQIKEMVFINSALQGRINEFREKIVTAKNERKFLLNKLLSYEKGGGNDNSDKILHGVLSKKSLGKKSEQIKVKVEPET